MELLFAIILGLFFGFALNRAGATNPENIINMLRLSDTRLMKAILFAIGLSSALLFTGLATGLIDPSHVSIKTAYWGVIAGGAILGIGFAIAGYCPGTGLAALATGRRDAFFFILGGLLGAFVFTLMYGWLAQHTGLFEKIAGGNVSLAQTGNDKYDALLPQINASIIGIGMGIVLMIIATILPLNFWKKCEK